MNHALAFRDPCVPRRRPLLAEAADGDIDQVRVVAREAGIVDHQPRCHLGLVNVQRHIGAGDQPAQRRHALCRLEIENNGTLAAVVDVESRTIAVPAWPQVTGTVAARAGPRP